MDHQRLGQPGLGLELCEQPVDVVDVLGPLDLGDHDDVECLAGLEHGGREVVEAPRGVEAVDPRPELGVAEVDGLGDFDQTGPCRLLVSGRDTVFEVGEQHVDLADHARHLAAHLLVRRGEEVDHPTRADRDLAERRGGADGERLEEILG